MVRPKHQWREARRGFIVCWAHSSLGRTRHTELGSVTRQRQRGREETCGQVPLLWFQRERTHEAGQTDLDLADLSNVSRLGGMGAVTTAWHLTLGQLEQLYIGPRV